MSQCVSCICTINFFEVSTNAASSNSLPSVSVRLEALLLAPSPVSVTPSVASITPMALSTQFSVCITSVNFEAIILVVLLLPLSLSVLAADSSFFVLLDSTSCLIHSFGCLLCLARTSGWIFSCLHTSSASNRGSGESIFMYTGVIMVMSSKVKSKSIRPSRVTILWSYVLGTLVYPF